MTNQEIIERLRKMKAAWMMTADTTPESQETVAWEAEAIYGAISALKGPTRKQVEKAWRGEWIDRRSLSDAPVECSNCGEWVYGKLQDANFCPFCGVPMTDEAVDMVMERMEEVQNDQ